MSSIKWTAHYRDVIRHEAMSCFRETFGGARESSSLFVDSFHNTLPAPDPEMIMTVGEGMPRRIPEFVDALVGTEEFEKYRADCLDYPALRQRIVTIRRARRAGKRFPEGELRQWLAEMLPERVDMTFGPVVVDEDLKQKFSESVDLTRCPAFSAS